MPIGNCQATENRHYTPPEAWTDHHRGIEESLRLQSSSAGSARCERQGIPIERINVVGTDGRKIAAYRFGDVTNLQVRRFGGRTGLSKQIKDALIARYGCRCFIYLEEMPEADLQIDHRVPFEVAGESETMSPDDFMLLCGSANRAKSWSCEHCDNRRSQKDREICLTCYWAYPESHSHVAMNQLRRVDLLWQGEETLQYEQLKADAAGAGLSIPDFVKEVLKKVISAHKK